MAETELLKGQVQWHSSDGEGGPDVGMLLALGAERYLWAGEISRSRWADAGPDAAALGNDTGWWLILYGPGETEVIGKCVSAEAAGTMIETLSALQTA
jgi:hypothetical protein